MTLIEKDENRDGLNGFFLFLAFTSPFHNVGFICLLCNLFFRKGRAVNPAFISFFIFFVILNYYFLGFDKLEFTSLFISPLFIILTIMLSAFIGVQSMVVFIVLVLLEGVVGLGEYTLGVKSFFYSESQSYYNSEFSYNRSVWGISNNSSVFAQKVLFSFVMFYYLLDVKRIKLPTMYLFCLFVLLYITFNRTAIVCVLAFFGFRYLMSFRLNIKYLIVFLFTFVFIAICFYFYSDLILYQFFRGRDFDITSGEFDMSGREFVWLSYIDFINNNFYFGNNSHHYKIFMNGTQYHAHSAYIQFFASNGVFIFSILMTYIALKLNRINIIYVFPLLVFSITQNSLFANFSGSDLFFWYLLFSEKQIDA